MPGIGGAPPTGGPPPPPDLLSMRGADRSFVTVDLSFLPLVISVRRAPYVRLRSAGTTVVSGVEHKHGSVSSCDFGVTYSIFRNRFGRRCRQTRTARHGRRRWRTSHPARRGRWRRRGRRWWYGHCLSQWKADGSSLDRVKRPRSAKDSGEEEERLSNALEVSQVQIDSTVTV